MQGKALVLLCVWSCAIEAVKQNALTIRAKRQECKCLQNQLEGGLTCSCSKAPGAEAAHMETETIHQTELAHELSNSIQSYPQSQARCGCLQIVFLGTPQYQCQCGDGNGNPLPSTTIPTPTTTMAPITTTPTQAPIEYPTVPTVTQGPGQCQCVMIRISGPASAQYQCNCDNTQEYPTLAETMPTPPPETFAPITYPPQTHAPSTEIPVTLPTEQTLPTQQQPIGQYPLTTTCVMYVGVQTSPCVCLPQYDQCAQNICCLKARYRSHKQAIPMQPQNDADPSTVDMLMNILKKIKNKLSQ
ncbi:hypothetical protein RB195_019483 [Necator americanus]|uniref:EB module n=1 Tax=Necator americanus TaxID=51031 RepID=A0ABR1CGG0_NECAM